MHMTKSLSSNCKLYTWKAKQHPTLPQVLQVLTLYYVTAYSKERTSGYCGPVDIDSQDTDVLCMSKQHMNSVPQQNHENLIIKHKTDLLDCSTSQDLTIPQDVLAVAQLKYLTFLRE